MTVPHWLVVELAMLRRGRGQTLKKTAKAAQVSPELLAAWETGAVIPSLAGIEAWAAAFGFGLTLEPKIAATNLTSKE